MAFWRSVPRAEGASLLKRVALRVALVFAGFGLGVTVGVFPSAMSGREPDLAENLVILLLALAGAVSLPLIHVRTSSPPKPIVGSITSKQCRRNRRAAVLSVFRGEAAEGADALIADAFWEAVRAGGQVAPDGRVLPSKMSWKQIDDLITQYVASRDAALNAATVEWEEARLTRHESERQQQRERNEAWQKIVLERRQLLVTTAAADSPLPFTAWISGQSNESIWAMSLDALIKTVDAAYGGREFVDDLMRHGLGHIVDTDIRASFEFLPVVQSAPLLDAIMQRLQREERQRQREEANERAQAEHREREAQVGQLVELRLGLARQIESVAFDISVAKTRGDAWLVNVKEAKLAKLRAQLDAIR